MKKDEKSVTELAKAYADAEKKIRAAASKKSGTVKEYKDALTETVMLAVSRLAVKSKTFAEKEIPAAFSDGQKSAGNHAPENHTEASAGNAANILKNAGFRYAAKVQGYDAYIELQNATQAAGKDFLSRVNAVIGKLSKEGKDAVYSVSQAVKEDIEKQGLLNVEYKGGRKVSLSSYAAMAARSARIESANIGTFGRALENGTDYVKCTEIYPTCEICAKYQGKIYCISGKDKRFPALFETALRHGYALMHPNCRHEFVPVWLETMSGAELAEMIEKSKISPKADTRSEEERNAYAAWQAKQRQIYHERLYFEQAKQRLGKAMPYESIAAFRRSYRTAEDTFAHKRSHNLISDYKKFQSYREELGASSLPKTLEKYQQIVYNENEHKKLLYYVDTRRKGTLSAVVSYSDWTKMQTTLENKFIGETAANGVKITSISLHFVDRVFGTIYQKRNGVSIQELQNVFSNGMVEKPVVRKDGEISQKIFLDGLCAITINPNTGRLIQCNPKRS